MVTNSDQLSPDDRYILSRLAERYGRELVDKLMDRLRNVRRVQRSLVRHYEGTYPNLRSWVRDIADQSDPPSDGAVSPRKTLPRHDHLALLRAYDLGDVFLIQTSDAKLHVFWCDEEDTPMVHNFGQGDNA
jgi:hypothetical protein